ncbi:MAG: tRNA dihydrouridine synthase DusB [Desulfocapsaceae bacterium]|nr:tRNA dihydrouridine synthase DusB [Desulfocapsaceae bacterium]
MLHIANLTLDSPFLLAPLAGYTDLPFRQLCREFGAGMVVSEMISCHGLVYGQAKTRAMLASNTAERPVAFQLFGADPAIMGEAAALLSTFHPDCIDINMGCPVKKVTKRGAGAALMQEPQLARAVLTSVINNSTVPVTVKTRIGVDSRNISAIPFARMVEDAGAAAITVHGRTWAQGFTGTADWDVIAQVKQAVSLPVIGNGDIHSYAQGLEMMHQTGCDGIMIGRAALGNPWVFSPGGKPSDLASLMDGVFRHLELIEESVTTDHMPGDIKNHLGRYFKALPESARYRKMIYDSKDLPGLRQALESIWAGTTGNSNWEQIHPQ